MANFTPHFERPNTRAYAANTPNVGDEPEHQGEYENDMYLSNRATPARTTSSAQVRGLHRIRDDLPPGGSEPVPVVPRRRRITPTMPEEEILQEMRQNRIRIEQLEQYIVRNQSSQARQTIPMRLDSTIEDGERWSCCPAADVIKSIRTSFNERRRHSSPGETIESRPTTTIGLWSNSRIFAITIRIVFRPSDIRISTEHHVRVR